MVWARRIFIAFLLLMLAGPASAAIERFSDDKGVIHITNTDRKKPQLEEADEEASPAPPVQPRPSAAPPSQESEASEPPEAEETPKPGSYLNVRGGVIHITNVPRQQNALALAQTGPTARPVAPAKSPAPQGKLENYEAAIIPAGFTGGALAAVRFRGQPESAAAPISKYTDAQGVIHISNASSARQFVGGFQVAGWSSAVAASKTVALTPPAAESKSIRTVPARPVEPDIPIQHVAYTSLAPDAAFPIPPFSLASAPSPVPRAASGVRRFRDAKGVIHIVGRGSAKANFPNTSSPSPGRTMANSRLPLPWTRGPGESHPAQLSGLLPSVRPESTILVRKNKQGALVIGNAPARQFLNRDKEEIRCRLELEPILKEAAFLAGLPVSLLEAVIRVESNFQPAAVSPKGAMGLMQLMPGTARFLQVEDPFCPRQNILGGAKYLRLLLDFFGQSLPLALAAYNAGFQRVIDAGYQIPAIKETQDFVTQVMGHYYFREKERYYSRRFVL
ncbi:MAG: transglycosylase SLT domain-containing protein [Deltaproteobacteria bacterium]|nr:transglycosylase SLT domain-containing protein [Desulfitobacteriaceae bacterium]MDI6854831.1 transglycosylase SLT domain-containing protein [Deltaproteobacteria bacterium]